MRKWGIFRISAFTTRALASNPEYPAVVIPVLTQHYLDAGSVAHPRGRTSLDKEARGWGETAEKAGREAPKRPEVAPEPLRDALARVARGDPTDSGSLTLQQAAFDGALVVRSDGQANAASILEGDVTHPCAPTRPDDSKGAQTAFQSRASAEPRKHGKQLRYRQFRWCRRCGRHNGRSQHPLRLAAELRRARSSSGSGPEAFCIRGHATFYS